MAAHTVKARRSGGFHGYEQALALEHAGMLLGHVAWGGRYQAGFTFVSLSGNACERVGDWATAQSAARQCPGYEVRRLDIALDTWDPAHGFDATLAAYRAGFFQLRGRPPKCEPMKPERPEDSAIIRIGNRAANKFLRGYEKGKRQLGPQGVAQCLRDGKMDEALLWWRLELEMKPQTAPLPVDMIDRRDEYFAGAYPYLARVLADVPARPAEMRRQRGPELELQRALASIRRQYGPTLLTAVEAHGGDIGAVWSKIVGSRHNDRLRNRLAECAQPDP